MDTGGMSASPDSGFQDFTSHVIMEHTNTLPQVCGADASYTFPPHSMSATPEKRHLGYSMAQCGSDSLFPVAHAHSDDQAHMYPSRMGMPYESSQWAQTQTGSPATPGNESLSPSVDQQAHQHTRFYFAHAPQQFSQTGYVTSATGTPTGGSFRAQSVRGAANQDDEDDTGSGEQGDPYSNVMVWLNQQACGGTVKRKRRISRPQRCAANTRERRRMIHLNTAFEELRERLPLLPHEKKPSRIQTLRMAMDYISLMSQILQDHT